MTDFSKEIREYLAVMRRDTRRNLTTSGSNATKKTWQSVRFDAGATMGNLIAHDTIWKVEDGTAPRNKGGKVNFWEIYHWAIAKGITVPEAEASKGIVGAIFWNIVREGTITWQHGGRRDIVTNVIQNVAHRSKFIGGVAKKTSLDIFEQLKKWR